MAKWLGGSTLDQRVVGLSNSPDLLQKVREEYLPTLCNSKEKAKGIMRCGHTENKEQGRTARFALYYSAVPLRSGHKLIPLRR